MFKCFIDSPRSVLSVVALVTACSVHAEVTTEEIIVTGEFRHANVLKVANSVSVINEELIAARNATNLEDLLNLAPNVNFSSGASRGRFIQIRGIGERSQFTAPINPSVGVIVDGIDFTGIATGVTALDTQQVEIFRGPQGTLYGANALAGMITVTGNAPTDAPYSKISMGASTYTGRDASMVVSSPLGENVGWRFGALKTKSDGFIENDFLNSKTTNNINETSFRNHIAVSAGNNIAIDLISYYIDVKNGYDAFSLDNNRHTLSDEPGQDKQESFANAVHLDYDGLSFAKLKTVISNSQSELDYGYDEDWSYQAICEGLTDCWPYSTADQYQRDNNNTSADIRLISKDHGQAVNWVGGVYYRKQNVDLTRSYTDNSEANTSIYTSEYDTKNVALYGELNIALGDALKLITGARLEKFSADFIDSDAEAFSPDENLWGGKAALEYTINDSAMLYALVSRGYKAGGANPDPDLESNLKKFDTETMRNYEIGSKTAWLNGLLTAQASVFYQQRKSIQVKQSRAYPSESGFEFTDFIDNAASGTNYGVELESTWVINQMLSVFGSMAILETDYKDFENRSHVDRNAQTGEGYDMSLRDQAHAPSYQYFAGLKVNIIEPLSLRLEFEGKDSFYFSESHNEQSEAINMLNLSMNYKVNNVSLTVWGKNITDETVETRGFYFSHDFGNDPRFGYRAEPYTQKGAPRTVGIKASVEF